MQETRTGVALGAKDTEVRDQGSTGTGSQPDATSGRAIAATLEQLIRVHFSQSFRGGLKPAQWHALRYFATAEPEMRTVTAFARHRASTMGTASTTISTLVRKGYLARDYGHGVPRNRGLHVTEDGLELLEQDPIHNLINAIDRLPESQRGTLNDALHQLVADMIDAPDQEADHPPHATAA